MMTSALHELLESRIVVLVHCVPVNAPKLPSVHSDFGAPVKVVRQVPLPVAAWFVSGNAALLIVVAAHLLKTMREWRE